MKIGPPITHIRPNAGVDDVARELRWGERGRDMSQKTVQLLIGQIVTDEELRLQFVEQPRETLTALRERGFELTPTEIDALVDTDRQFWDSAAARIHPRLQRCCLRAFWREKSGKGGSHESG
jgi:hypothetical protein